jgi:hypothetical protein
MSSMHRMEKVDHANQSTPTNPVLKVKRIFSTQPVNCWLWQKKLNKNFLSAVARNYRKQVKHVDKRNRVATALSSFKYASNHLKFSSVRAQSTTRERDLHSSVWLDSMSISTPRQTDRSYLDNKVTRTIEQRATAAVSKHGTDVMMSISKTRLN